jgi:hypothetical protein
MWVKFHSHIATHFLVRRVSFVNVFDDSARAVDVRDRIDSAALPLVARSDMVSWRICTVC